MDASTPKASSQCSKIPAGVMHIRMGECVAGASVLSELSGQRLLESATAGVCRGWTTLHGRGCDEWGA